MEQVLQLLLLLVMGAQFGVALASSIIVHPILLVISRTAALETFSPFFLKTHKSMITMSVVGTVVSLILSVVTGVWWWFGVSLLMHLNGPYTLKFMMPTNNRLMAKSVDPYDPQTGKDISNWGVLHAVRTVWNGLIFLAYLILALFL